MTISFDSIPSALRTPGSYVEFNTELAGATSTEFKMLVIGQRLSNGTQSAGVPVLVTDPSRAAMLFGRGSMLHGMVAAALNASTTVEMWAVALDDLEAGTAATGTMVVDSAATEAGTLYVYLGGVRVAVGIASTDDAAAIAASIAAAINSSLDLPVTATVSTNTVTVKARHKGEFMNGFDLRTSYYDEEEPAGLSVTCSNLSSGSGNPDVTAALDAMGDEWFNWCCTPYTDTANLLAVDEEMDSRFGPMRQQGCRAFAAYAGTLSAAGTFGNTRNNPHVVIMATNDSPTPTYLVASILMATAAASLSIDPTRPCQTLELKGMKAPVREARWIQSERNVLLFDGISTFTVDRSDGTCRIERLITTYQTNQAGMPDASYLDINTPETLERFRYEQRSLIAQMYPRHKLASDGTQYGAGQAIVTPVIIKGQFLALYRELETKGWVEDYDTYKANLIVERNADDANRLDWRDTPNLVNQFRVGAGKTQFIV
ncbi:phage tail sheath subtilisin-like domain-containing protein [Oceanobacter kriegii]|uniref:phage tail sheath subtilisin-like domain-containing protein n=1 Tax=Oceanobacter kriegii TaxID=64972 RepID=UPI0003F98350|nr:phage tail sheath subtilisin-like domain-containing protein [Oceanobacter kriegii]